MASPLLRTKLFIPRLPTSLVARSRLSERLGSGAASRLTVVSAPAGFGKTTAVAAWLQLPNPHPVAWLSLDESDRQPSAFWTYVVTALQGVVPGLGDGILEVLQSARPPVQSVLATMLNELGDLSDELFLVLDDYHLVDGPAIGEGMAFLIEHLPPQVHVVLVTRSDPGLPLSRLRVRGELLEIRAADLRFTPEEVSRYFTESGRLKLSESDMGVLATRTEGWVAALQLAALSMQGRPDVSTFIQGFAGDNTYIVDYLVEEVLGRESEEVRSFLLQTSVLDRLTGDLCDAVTGHGGGKTMLDAVSRANLFLVALDDNRTWYRYHHLFADVLVAHLREEGPDQIVELHSRASRWFEDAGEALPAVRHALAAGDVDRAANLVELALPGLRRDRKEATIRGWLDLIPDAVVRARPVLAIGFVGALMAAGDFDQARARLPDVARWLEPPDGDGENGPALEMVVADEAERGRLAGFVELYRAGIALVEGDLAATHRHVRQVIKRAAPDDEVTRAGAVALSGLAHWAVGDLEAAHRAYSTSREGLLGAGHIPDVLGCSIAMADIRVAQGRLGDALATYSQALALADRDGSAVRGVADMHVGFSQVWLERGELQAAAEAVQRSQELGERLGLPQHPYRWRKALAMLRAAQGDPAGALKLLAEAEAVFTTDFSPDVSPPHALRVRFLTLGGDVDSGLRWARQHGLSVDDELSYLREYEHITLARVLLVQFTAQRDETAASGADGLLRRLLVAAEQGGRMGSVIEILVLQALVRHHADGDAPDAVPLLERALILAEPEGYARVFTEEGPGLIPLLERLVGMKPGWDYPRRLLTTGAQPPTGRVGAPSGQRGPQQLLDPLSEREQEVLGLLTTQLTGPELASHLVVSLNTLRTHTKNIYAKLGVNSRRAAVHRAAELGLLNHPSS